MLQYKRVGYCSNGLHNEFISIISELTIREDSSHPNLAVLLTVCGDKDNFSLGLKVPSIPLPSNTHRLEGKGWSPAVHL